MWAVEFSMNHLKKAEGHIGRNVVSITIKIRSIFKVIRKEKLFFIFPVKKRN